MEFLIAALVLSVLLNISRIKRVFTLDEQVGNLENELFISQDAITRKNRENTNLRKQIQDMYKTIDDYTSEKSEVSCETEVTEKILKKRKK